MSRNIFTMPSTQEVELRALLTEEQFAAIMQMLSAQAGGHEIIEVEDAYFCPKDKEPHLLREVGSYALRLRRENRNDIIRATLNSKTLTAHGDHNAWEEHEVTVDNFEEAEQLLLQTEFKKFFSFTKTRTIFHVDGIGIFLEDIVDFGKAIETELMVEKGREEEAKQTLRTFLSSIGIGEEAILPQSITSLIMQQRVSKDF